MLKAGEYRLLKELLSKGHRIPLCNDIDGYLGFLFTERSSSFERRLAFGRHSFSVAPRDEVPRCPWQRAPERGSVPPDMPTNSPRLRLVHLHASGRVHYSHFFSVFGNEQDH